MTDWRVEELATFALEFTGPNACKVQPSRIGGAKEQGETNAPVDEQITT